MYKKFTEDSFPLEAEWVAVDSGTGKPTGCEYHLLSEPEEDSSM